MLVRFLQLVCLLFFLRKSDGKEFAVWSTWNRAENIKFGILDHPDRLRRDEAETLCKSKHFNNLVTVRSEEESTELKDIIRLYHRALSKFFDPSEFSSYWLGVHGRERKPHWQLYDRERLTYSNWYPGNPKDHKKRLCVVIQWKYKRELDDWTLFWQNRECTQTKGIFRTICERREKRINDDEVAKELEKTPHFKWTNYSEQIAKKLWKASQQGGFNDDVVRRNIKHLEKFAAKSRNHLVTENTVKYFVRMAKDYQDSAFKRNSNFTVEQRQSVVRNLEILVNNVKISGNKTSMKFNTSTIFYEVHYLDPQAEPKAYVFSFNQPGSEHVSLTVSSEAVGRLQGKVGVGNKSRLSFIKFSSSNLFASKYNSPQVLSAQINGKTINGLTSPITFLMPPEASSNNTNIPFVQCAAWSFNTSSWSNRGCWLQTRNSTPVCACNHMTNFALLVQLFQRPLNPIFDKINLILGSLSCVGFFLVAVIYISFAELRNSKPAPVHINLCCCYTMAYVIFLSGSNNKSNDWTCLIVTVLSHYFFLACWFWTFVEALTLYQFVVKKCLLLKRRFYVLTSLISYLLPLFIVGINVGVAVGYVDSQPQNEFYRLTSAEKFLYNSSYVSNYACWLTSKSLYFGFLAVGGIILVVNIVIYVVVVKAITCSRKKVHSSRKRSFNETFYHVIAIGLLTGLTWSLAIPMELLAMSPALVAPVTFTFSVLIAVQGIVIFYLLCVHNRTVRRHWFDPLWRFMKEDFCCKRTHDDQLKKRTMLSKTSTTSLDHTNNPSASLQPSNNKRVSEELKKNNK